MNFAQPTDDPHGVQRLLEILRRQQHSSSTSTAPPAANPFAASNIPTSTAETSTPPSSESDAARRRRTYNADVNKFGIATNTDEPFDPYSFNPFSSANAVLTAPTTTAASKSKPAQKDLSELTFAESLPILSTLSSDKTLLRRLNALGTQQEQLEKRLAKEYNQFAAIKHKQYPNPKLRAHEDEKRRKQMLNQWDELVRQQQKQLVRAGLPGCKLTNDRKAVDKQTKILAVLVEMLDEIE